MLFGLIMGLIVSLSFNPLPIRDYCDDGEHVEFINNQVVDKETREKLDGLPKQNDRYRIVVQSVTRIDDE